MDTPTEFELARLRAENASLAESAKEQWAMAEASMAQLVQERDAASAEAHSLQALIERRRIERDDIRASAARWEESALKAEAELAQARAERDVLRERWESEPALDALDGVLEAAVEGIDEYAALYQGRRQEYIDTIRRDIDAVQAAQRAARGEIKQSGQQAWE